MNIFVVVTLMGRDTIFLAPNTEINFKEKPVKKGLAKFRNCTVLLKASLLTRNRKNITESVQIRTPNSIVGVKGTEVIELLKKATNMVTLKGIVILKSLARGDSITC